MTKNMETLATGYANFVIGQADYEEKRTGKKPLVFVEQLLEMDYAPDTHGTADAIIIAGDTLTIIDNKTGFIPVKIFEGNELNSQLGIYGLYAYKLFADIYPIKKIRLVIYQERIHNIDDQTIDVEDHPAISRVDNVTAICPLCGTREALDSLGIKGT